MTFGSFELGRLPRITFGPGRFESLPEAVARHGRYALIVTGSRSFKASNHWSRLLEELDEGGVEHDTVSVAGEPSPEVVDEAVAAFRSAEVDVVVGIGGGSALDAAKAIAGLLRTGTSVMDHLEVVGRGLPYPGPAVPLIAVPTTAGTGSEATRNAVLSRPGPGGFKRSFRDERLVAADAIVDPDLLAGASQAVVAANGLDAVTQLLESFVSLRASPVTDGLARSGLAAARDGFIPFWSDPSPGGDPEARSAMAYAALVSGICLANAGLGVSHGLAAPLGGRFEIPHGVACGETLVEGVRANVQALTARGGIGSVAALAKYAEAGRILANLKPGTPDEDARDALVETLGGWTRRVSLRGLSAYGMAEADIEAIVGDSRAGSMLTNPVELTDEELAGVLRASQ